MASVIGVMGHSGSGKTTACRHLDPKSTYYIDSDLKGLSWKGWKSQFNSANKNYCRVSKPAKVDEIITGVSNSCPQIKTIVIDTVNGIMVDEEMSRMKDKGYDKWQDLALSVYGLITKAHFLRDDLVVVFMFHVQDDVDENGNHFYHILTGGRKLEKIRLESKLTTVLFAKCVDGRYFFETQARNSTAKSPMGLFDSLEIPNDLNDVINKMRTFE